MKAEDRIASAFAIIGWLYIIILYSHLFPHIISYNSSEAGDRLHHNNTIIESCFTINCNVGLVILRGIIFKFFQKHTKNKKCKNPLDKCQKIC